LLNIILALIALGVLVTVHEAGHFFAARICGVKVEAFSIGFGKPLLKWTKSGIEYRLAWIPLGGYVKMKGEALEENAPEEEDSFQYTKWWKKLIIAFSGPFANFILAVLIFILTFMLPSKVEDQYPVVGKASGQFTQIFLPGDSILAVNNKPVRGWYEFLSGLHPEKQNSIILQRAGKKLTLTLPKIQYDTLANSVLPSVSAKIGDVNPGMSAWRGGLQSGDIIVQIDTVKVRDWYQMRELIVNAKADKVRVTVQRGDSLFTRTLELEPNPLVKGQRLIGIGQYMPVTYSQSYPPLKALSYGVKASVNFVVINYVGLYKIFTRPETIKSSVGGPVMIYSLSSESARKGLNSWLMFVAAISLALMIMNLLPIPVLDGGYVLFALIQAVTGKPLSRKIQIILQNIGFFLLMLLMVYAFYNDFSKVIARAMSNLGTH